MCSAWGATALTGNYAGSLGNASRSKQRIKVSGEEEIKALFYAKTWRKRACVYTLAGTVHTQKKPLWQTQWVFFSLTLTFLSRVTQSGVRINMMCALLLLWIAKAEILLTHYLTEGITRGFVGKNCKNPDPSDARGKLQEHVGQTSFSKKHELLKENYWQISISRFSCIVPVKMMLIQIKDEKNMRGTTSLTQHSGSWDLNAPDLQADWWDFLTGSQQRRHTHGGTCTHTTLPRSSFPVSTGLLRNLLVTSQNPAGHGNPTQRPACILAVRLMGVYEVHVTLRC